MPFPLHEICSYTTIKQKQKTNKIAHMRAREKLKFMLAHTGFGTSALPSPYTTTSKSPK